MKDSTDGGGGTSSPSQAGTGLCRIECSENLVVVVLMLDNDVLDLASKFSIIHRRSFADRTVDNARLETPLGDPESPDFLAPIASPSLVVAAGVDA
jgi:hypothetical protein